MSPDEPVFETSFAETLLRGRLSQAFVFIAQIFMRHTRLLNKDIAGSENTE